MPDQFDAPSMDETGVGMAIHSPSGELNCPGCGKKYAKDSDFLRHWRVPIPCQMPNCLKTFRDDKRRAYLNHHASEHRNDEQNGLTQAKLESYFYGSTDSSCYDCGRVLIHQQGREMTSAILSSHTYALASLAAPPSLTLLASKICQVLQPSHLPNPGAAS
jgi:hypothetical protein